MGLLYSGKPLALQLNTGLFWMLETKSLTSCVWHKAATQWMGANLYKYEEGWHYISNTKISRGSPPPFFGALIFRQLEDGSCKHLNTLSKAVCYYQSKEHVSTVLPTVGMTTAKWMQITQTCNTFTFGKQRQKVWYIPTYTTVGAGLDWPTGLIWSVTFTCIFDNCWACL